jgi:hypothetical protein
MASKSSSGTTKEERETFLKEQGFTQLRSGKGSHVIWEHAAAKALAQTGKFPSAPENIASSNAQQPWVITLPADPARGTWRTISKTAEWCQNTAAGLGASASHTEQRSATVQQFHESREEFCTWKKEVKNKLKVGLDVSGEKSPVKYSALQALRGKLT